MTLKEAVQLMRHHQKGYRDTPKSYKILKRHHQQKAEYYEDLVDRHLVDNQKPKAV